MRDGFRHEDGAAVPDRLRAGVPDHDTASEFNYGTTVYIRYMTTLLRGQTCHPNKKRSLCPSNVYGPLTSSAHISTINCIMKGFAELGWIIVLSDEIAIVNRKWRDDNSLKLLVWHKPKI